MCGDIGLGWNKSMGCQTKTLHQSMKTLTTGLSHVIKSRPTVLCLSDFRK